MLRYKNDIEKTKSDTILQNFKESYDFIIVGGGSAGPILANRLTEIGDWDVLMTEAGEDETSVGQIPLLAPYLSKSKNDWQYTTVPQGNGLCTALKNNKYILSNIIEQKSQNSCN